MRWFHVGLITMAVSGGMVIGVEYSEQAHAQSEAEGWQALPKAERERIIRERREKIRTDIDASTAFLPDPQASLAVTLDARTYKLLERLVKAEESIATSERCSCKGGWGVQCGAAVP